MGSSFPHVLQQTHCPKKENFCPILLGEKNPNIKILFVIIYHMEKKGEGKGVKEVEEL